jgi:hypothetical protein
MLFLRRYLMRQNVLHGAAVVRDRTQMAKLGVAPAAIKDTNVQQQ